MLPSIAAPGKLLFDLVHGTLVSPRAGGFGEVEKKVEADGRPEQGRKINSAKLEEGFKSCCIFRPTPGCVRIDLHVRSTTPARNVRSTKHRILITAAGVAISNAPKI